MSQEANIALNLAAIRRTQATYAIGSTQRLERIHRFIEGILRAKRATYNAEHYEAQ